MAKLTVNQAQVVKWMKANGGSHFAAEIAEGCGLAEKSVRPILTGLAKATKERAEIFVCVDSAEKEVLNKEGQPEIRAYKIYGLTEEGMTTDIEVKE